MIENQKGAANLIATMAYLLISFVIIAMVTVSATDLLSRSKEQANYKAMLDYFDTFDIALTDTIANKQITEFTFYNPGEIEIDCTNNKIIGRIDYSGDYKSEETIINDIITYKKNNQIIFEKDLNITFEKIQLICIRNVPNKGKNTQILEYSKYNEESKKIEIEI